MKTGIIGRGAIAGYVTDHLAASGHVLAARLLRSADPESPVPTCTDAADLPDGLDVVIDCAGHAALRQHGAAILQRGTDLVTLSLGALADPDLRNSLHAAAEAGGASLHLASGAIGALDCLQAGRAGGLTRVAYTGRKPPQGWKGSPAEDTLDLSAITTGAHVHFEGTARKAALEYPKNANVAAAVALAGLGFDDTQVRLVADADVTENIHEIAAEGAFGHFQFRIAGRSLPDTPRSSALAAMSVLAKLDQLSNPVTL